MAERGPEEIRREIAVERGRLEESRDALRAELRSFVPVIAVGLVALGLFTARKGFLGGVRMIRKLS
jgi:hypothetical protein